MFSGTDEWVTIIMEAPLNEMFGYAAELRSNTQGKGEFTMEYARYAPAVPELQDKLIQQYREALEDQNQAKGKRKN